ncbi:MAG: hypothetical protein B6U73_01815 [Desulfurococcales archaeon ex4484_204]|nr:MAG: hypothetical protein B6U73_01815 [Desulfurococcales archaeon ex4484_204]
MGDAVFRVRRTGISELYVDLTLTLIALAISGTLLTAIPSMTSDRGLADRGMPRVSALLVKVGATSYLLLISNYGDSNVTCRVVGPNGSTYSVVEVGHGVSVVKLDEVLDEVLVLVGTDYVVKPRLVDMGW